LDTEYHWDQGAPFGTVRFQIDTGIDLPNDIPVESQNNQKLFDFLDDKTKFPDYTGEIFFI
jgi:hypothetical protein